MKRYRAFGLEIDSDLELAELAPGSASSSPDVHIVLGPAQASMAEVSEDAEIRVDPHGLQISFTGVATFLLRPDRNVIQVQAVRGAEELVPLPLLGPVLALWLHLKGHLVLHASAVSLEHQAFALLGDKGAGKSTTAAALLACGGELLTDDLLRLRWSPTGPPVCEPAYAQVKLTAASAAAFEPCGAQSLASPHPEFTKRRFRLAAAPPEATPLKMICILARGGELSIKPMAPADALKACLEQVFVRRYGAAVLAGGQAARQFRDVARLVGLVATVRLCVPDDLDELQELKHELMRLLQAAAN